METTKQLIEKINKLFIDNDMEKFMDYLADDMVWEMYSSTSGHTTLKGKEEIGSMDAGNMPEEMNFRFETVIVEGDIAIANGSSTGTTKDGKPYKGNFCDIYQFKDDKIIKMTSYVIESIG
ncbi:nuclear transport factor 2 family protein [Pedobacter metabolipauper]|uniref:Ketosteroid isomerase-like protein n=1 Tax=Pedobacter metabolipauper TaxID=425513 RepID=A0A4R6SUM1_9SPHI|nr:nuclear transport factor 2 family protein [Pedobacter metabolipauper]TDQ08111.1 ketosteroid isomerase-like protein [Pedobacter metabolipauper]